MNDKNNSPKNDYKSTPPTNKKVRNPFDKALIDRLHKPICSPGMCKIYKNKSKGSFRWDINQASTLVPVDIVACNSQFEPSPDPALEKIAEEATERFFSQEMVMPSPLESSKKVKPIIQEISTDIITIPSCQQPTVTREISVQTVLTLPPVLPPEVEKFLEPFCTYTYEQNISGDYEITANGSLRRKLFFEEHSDAEHYDSEHTDDEIHMEQRPPSSFDAHTPIVFSPDLSRELIGQGVKRTFGTPLNKIRPNHKSCNRNKILDVVDFGEPCFSPIEFRTPKRINPETASSSSLASTSISPVAKTISSDEEKNTFTSPESDTKPKCLECILESEVESRTCVCKVANSKSILTRSASLKESPPRSRKGSLSFEKRSLSMSSLHRSRSVQKLDFSMDMSVDGSIHDQSHADSESSPSHDGKPTWSIVDETSIHDLVKKPFQISKDIHTFKLHTNERDTTLLDNTPLKAKCKSNVLSHEISKIRAPIIMSPAHMSLDNSLDNFENPLSLEDKKLDFNNVDLKYLTENSRFDCTKVDSSISFKRVDSGFNENTFYGNASSYYESAIKPSELTVTDISKKALKEISNVHWRRLDSGFRDENSGDSVNFYPSDESSVKKITSFRFESNVDDKENVNSGNFDKFLMHSSNKTEAMSMSDIFTDDMTFNCNFSSTPSKNKRKIHP